MDSDMIILEVTENMDKTMENESIKNLSKFLEESAAERNGYSYSG